MKKILKKVRNGRLHYLTSQLFENFYGEGFKISYSQNGEDLILQKLLGGKKNGFYLDIGCNQPIQKSNTFKLYLNGWSGICVDGNKEVADKFKKIRPRDTVLTEILSNNREPLTFYLSQKLHEQSSVDHPIDVDDVTQETRTPIILSDVFKMANRHVDLLCMDIEGHDYNVLTGNDFDLYRPEFICIEGHLVGGIVEFLTAKQYELLAYDGENLYFKDLKSDKK